MKKINLYAIWGVLMLGFSSCNDFLDESPKYNLTKEYAVVDYASAKNIVNGAYSKLTATTLGGEIAARLSVQAGVWSYASYSTNAQLAYRQGNNDGATIWKQLYTVVNAANAAIESVSALADGKYPNVAEKNRLIAEARCLRAFTYLQIHWLWSYWWDNAESPYGLIYRDKIADLENLQAERLSVGESYERILEDLTYAETYLNDIQSNRYMSRQFAQALHAKLLLNRGWTGDYAEALALVQDIKAHSPAAFALETDLAKTYTDAWDSKDVLFSRYLGDLPSTTTAEFIYSYTLFYDNLLAETPQAWVENDPRYPVISGEARAAETWDTSTRTVYTKLYRTGRYSGPTDKYATYYFRYPELYLMEAELKFRLNPADISGALAPINELRRQYTNPVLPPLTASTAEAFSETLFKEIVVSQFLENGSEWFASIRLQKDGKPWLHTMQPELSISPAKYCWPIPDDEMINHENKISQNPTLE
ncbi:MAG: RagB/SusD family nutrient uptake outer membrane protein [Tannerella sp.]|jgi:hypothetical protein|nr:RagB/SusD family nutrient uptake outer membrane protein [Tannerella sp.]